MQFNTQNSNQYPKQWYHYDSQYQNNYNYPGGNQYGGNQYGGNQYGGNQYGGNQGNQSGGNQYRNQPGNQYGNQFGANDVDGYNNYNNRNYNWNAGDSDSGRNNYDKNQLYGGGEGQGLYADSRKGFIRKVYTLLSIQLVITALIALWAMNSTTFKNIFMNTPMIIVVSVALMALSFVVACCQDFVRKYGLPIIIIFTLLFSILVGIICAQTKSSVVLTAFGITAFLVIALTAYACFTKSDLTGCGPYLFILCMVLFVFGIVLIFWRNPIVHLIYSCLACLLYCVFLIYDTQLVLGRFQNAYSLDDAYIAAIQLYIDIIEIFIQLVQILGFIDN